MVTDPIGDLLTRIRNANKEFKEKVDVPSSKFKEAIVKVLKEDGFISNYKKVEDRKQGILRIYLKYTQDRKRVIKGIKSVSKPGIHIYRESSEIPRVFGGLGIAIISTSKGVMTDDAAREIGVGGEIICYVW